MPDIDVFFGWAPWAPLAMHRGFTHGLVGGVLLMPPLLAGLLWLFDRWQARRGAGFPGAPDMRFGWLVALCYFGAITHPLLDLQNAYAVQLLSPISRTWFHTDGLFIVDPWVWLMLGLGIWRARAGTSGRPATIALLAVVAYVGVNIGISGLAHRAAAAEAGAGADRIVASPLPLAFWRRNVIWRRFGMIGGGRHDVLRSPFALLDRDPIQPDNMADPLVRRAMRGSRAAEKFLAWSIMPMAEVDRRGCTARVTFRDARFRGPRFEDSFAASADVSTGAAGCPSR